MKRWLQSKKKLIEEDEEHEKSLRPNHRYARQPDHRGSRRGLLSENWPGFIRTTAPRPIASVLRIDDDLVTLQVFENTRGISTGDQVTFLDRQMQATFTDSLSGTAPERRGRSDRRRSRDHRAIRSTSDSPPSIRRGGSFPANWSGPTSR